MRSITISAVVAAGTAWALPQQPSHGTSPLLLARRQVNESPFVDRKLYVSSSYVEQLEETFESFMAVDDTENALKTRTVQNTGTFVWAPSIAGLTALDTAIEGARAEQEESGVEQIIGLVLYNLPDRDCSAGESAGELSGEEGLQKYKDEYVDAWAERLSEASDLTFAVVVEPDAVGNMVTNQHIEFCAQARPIQEEGIAYALQQLQFDNVHLYLDASHGGWLGWPDNLPLSE